MRVTGGKLRGYRIKFHSAAKDLRPSQDKIRESIFNILGDINDTLVVDLYSGTGVLGIEALSRGARHCDFVEKEPATAEVIRQNLNNPEIQHKADLYTERVESFLQHPHHQNYDLVFMDPPYTENPSGIFHQIPNFMTADGHLIYLHGQQIVLRNDDREMLGKKLQLLDNRTHGGTQISILGLRASETHNQDG